MFHNYDVPQSSLQEHNHFYDTRFCKRTSYRLCQTYFLLHWFPRLRHKCTYCLAHPINSEIMQIQDFLRFGLFIVHKNVHLRRTVHTLWQNYRTAQQRVYGDQITVAIVLSDAK